MSKEALPRDFERWNPAFRGAFKKGMQAQRDGLPLSACPYLDKRKPSGMLSWSRAFENTWRDGWDWAAQLKAKEVS